MNCQNCSNSLSPGAKFCGNCGQLIDANPPASALQSPVVPIAAHPADLAPDNPLYVPLNQADGTDGPPPAQQDSPASGPRKLLSVKWPAISGLILGALYLLGSSVGYVEVFQDHPRALIIALAAFDIFLGLLLFVPGLLLLTTNKKSHMKLLKIEYIASLVLVVLSVILFRLAGLLFLIPALLAKRVRDQRTDRL